MSSPNARPSLRQHKEFQRPISYYRDKAFIEQKMELYSEGTKACATTKTGMEIFFRPFELTDAQRMIDFFQGLSEDTLYRRFFSSHNCLDTFLQKTIIADLTKETILLVIIQYGTQEKIIAIGQYHIHSDASDAEIALVVSDKYQNQGIGRELLNHLVEMARKQGIRYFNALMLMDNWPMLHLCETIGFSSLQKKIRSGIYELKMSFANKFSTSRLRS